MNEVVSSEPAAQAFAAGREAHRPELRVTWCFGMATGLSGLALAAVALLAPAGPLAGGSAGIGALAEIWTHSAVGVAYCLLALVILMRAFRSPGAVALGLAFAAIGLSTGVATAIAIGRVPARPWIASAAFAYGAAAFLRATQLFPEPLDRDRVRLRHANGALGRPVGLILRGLLGPAAVWLGVGPGLFVLWLLAPFAQAVLRPVVLLLGLAYLYVQFRRGSEITRRKIFWFLQAVVIAVVLSVLELSVHAYAALAEVNLPLGELSRWRSVATTLGVVGCCATGIFFAGALDARLAIQRTAVFGGVITLVVVVLGVIEQIISQKVAEWLGMNSSTWAAVSGALVGFVLRPMHDAMKRSVGRLLGLSGPVRPVDRSVEP